jgi:hypothetical protein
VKEEVFATISARIMTDVILSESKKILDYCKVLEFILTSYQKQEPKLAARFVTSLKIVVPTVDLTFVSVLEELI